MNLNEFYGPNAGYVWELLDRYRRDELREFVVSMFAIGDCPAYGENQIRC